MGVSIWYQVIIMFGPETEYTIAKFEMERKIRKY